MKGQIQVVSGRFVGHGAYKNYAQGGPITIYESVRFAGDDGRDVFLENVVAPEIVCSYAPINTTGKFYIAEVVMPTFFFGTGKVYCLFAVEVGGRTIEGVERVAKQINTSRLVQAAQAFIGGIPGMFIFGLGLLIWWYALRLLSVKVPEREMREALKQGGGV